VQAQSERQQQEPSARYRALGVICGDIETPRDMILTATRFYPSRKWELRFSDALYSVAALCGGKETPRFRTRRDACAFALANGGNAATFRGARFRSEGAIGRKYHGAEIATSLRVYARDVAA